jgi:hypothetical protein
MVPGVLTSRTVIQKGSVKDRVGGSARKREAYHCDNHNQSKREVMMSTITFVTEWPVEGGPDGIAVSLDGEVFVNINNNWRVVKYSAEGDRLAEWSFEGESSGIAVSPDGEVFVNINNNYRIVEYGANGEVFVNINNNYRVVKYSAEGDRLEEWPFQGASSGIAVSPDGGILRVNNTLRAVKCSAAGDPLAEWSVVAGVIETNGIVVSPNGEVFITVSDSHRVMKYSAEGELLAAWGGEGDQPGEFRSPVGVALGPDGLVYVADKGNSRIQVFQCS